MVQGFGLLLVAGIAVALVCALTAGSAALVLAERDGGVLGASVRGAAEIVGRRWRGAGEIAAAWRVARVLRRSAAGSGRCSAVTGARPARGRRAAAGRIPRRRRWPGARAGRLIAAVMRHPGRVLAVAAVLAVAGWVADTQTAVQSDVTKLVPDEHAGAAQPPHAGEGDRRVGRDRRHRAGGRRRHPGHGAAG